MMESTNGASLTIKKEGQIMKARTYSKHSAQWQKPFHDAIAHYNAKIYGCKRWHNRRKAQKQYNDKIWRKYKHD